ncbi:hypothetical protein [Bradyrhizobium sp. AZCC 2289]|uniref:hypothetical protein n=1 Tax=Bradyrhizobium sp. AZCC 2289 TaxID=3117026 RepID=UPI002FF2E7A2
MARKPSDLVQVKFRITERLRRLIEAEAKKNKRTQAQEMVQRLEKSFADDVLSRDWSLHREATQFQAEALKKIAEHIGRPDIAAEITARPKKGETSNG